MASEDQMVAAKAYITKTFNENVTNDLNTYIEEEELEYTDVVSDLREPLEGCTAMESLTDTTADYTATPALYKPALYRALREAFGINAQLTLPSSIVWEMPSETEQKETRDYINEQLFNAFSDFDASFIEIVTIGRKHNVNLVPLLNDIFSAHKWRNGREDLQLTHPAFCGKSSLLKRIKEKDEASKKVYNSLIQTLASFQNRIAPNFKIGFMQIEDDINAYIEYTLCLATMLHNVISTQKCLPLLVDFWLIPPKVREDINEDDEDSDEEDEEDEKDEAVAEEGLTKDFSANLQAHSSEVVGSVTGSVDWTKPAECVRVMSKLFQQILKKNRRSVKICVIIDRRHSPNQVLVYQLPLLYSAIPRNYCNETLIYSSRSHLMWDCDNSVHRMSKQKWAAAKAKAKGDGGDPVFGGAHDASGSMFALSFSMHETNRNRVQFWKNGGGLRFWPRYMLEMWPQMFVKGSGAVDKKYTMEYVKERFGLDTEDAVFEEWKKAIIDWQ